MLAKSSLRWAPALFLLGMSGGCFRLGLDAFAPTDPPDAAVDATRDSDLDDSDDDAHKPEDADDDVHADTDVGPDSTPEDADRDDSSPVDADDERDTDPDIDSDTDPDGSCVELYGECVADEDCCGAIPCTWPPMGTRGVCCVSAGDPCTTTADCCHGLCGASEICE